jgi:hypothetical protein
MESELQYWIGDLHCHVLGHDTSNNAQDINAVINALQHLPKQGINLVALGDHKRYLPKDIREKILECVEGCGIFIIWMCEYWGMVHGLVDYPVHICGLTGEPPKNEQKQPFYTNLLTEIRHNLTQTPPLEYVMKEVVNEGGAIVIPHDNPTVLPIPGAIRRSDMCRVTDKLQPEIREKTLFEKSGLAFCKVYQRDGIFDVARKRNIAMTGSNDSHDLQMGYPLATKFRRHNMSQPIIDLKEAAKQGYCGTQVINAQSGNIYSCRR